MTMMDDEAGPACSGCGLALRVLRCLRAPSPPGGCITPARPAVAALRRLLKGIAPPGAREVASLGTSGNAHYRTWACPSRRLQRRRQLKKGHRPRGQAPRRAKAALARLDIMHLHYVAFPRRGLRAPDGNAARGPSGVARRPLKGAPRKQEHTAGA